MEDIYSSQGNNSLQNYNSQGYNSLENYNTQEYYNSNEHYNNHEDYNNQSNNNQGYNSHGNYNSQVYNSQEDYNSQGYNNLEFYSTQENWAVVQEPKAYPSEVARKEEQLKRIIEDAEEFKRKLTMLKNHISLVLKSMQDGDVKERLSTFIKTYYSDIPDILVS